MNQELRRIELLNNQREICKKHEKAILKGIGKFKEFFQLLSSQSENTIPIFLIQEIFYRLNLKQPNINNNISIRRKIIKQIPVDLLKLGFILYSDAPLWELNFTALIDFSGNLKSVFIGGCNFEKPINLVEIEAHFVDAPNTLPQFSDPNIKAIPLSPDICIALPEKIHGKVFVQKFIKKKINGVYVWISFKDNLFNQSSGQEES